MEANLILGSLFFYFLLVVFSQLRDVVGDPIVHRYVPVTIEFEGK